MRFGIAVKRKPVADEWQTIGVWAGENTPVNAVFMNPVVKANIPPYTDEEVGGASDAIFNYTAHRRVWVGFKKGAAVMWSPSYYYVWHRRVSEVSSLVTHQEKLDYAQKNGLAYRSKFASIRPKKKSFIRDQENLRL